MVEQHAVTIGDIRLSYAVTGDPGASPLVLLHALGSGGVTGRRSCLRSPSGTASVPPPDDHHRPNPDHRRRPGKPHPSRPTGSSRVPHPNLHPDHHPSRPPHPHNPPQGLQRVRSCLAQQLVRPTDISEIPHSHPFMITKTFGVAKTFRCDSTKKSSRS